VLKDPPLKNCKGLLTYCTMKVVVIFGIFGTICAMVLLISPERTELESCACAQIEALDEQNGSLYPGDVWDLSEKGKYIVKL